MTSRYSSFSVSTVSGFMHSVGDGRICPVWCSWPDPCSGLWRRVATLPGWLETRNGETGTCLCLPATLTHDHITAYRERTICDHLAGTVRPVRMCGCGSFHPLDLAGEGHAFGFAYLFLPGQLRNSSTESLCTTQCPARRWSSVVAWSVPHPSIVRPFGFLIVTSSPLT
jgi:hypothetical protein